MTDLMGRGPLGQKTPKAKKKPKGMRQVSKKRQDYWLSPQGKADLSYMAAVKGLPCAACGSPAPNDAHHCKDLPPADYNNGMGPYERLPGAGMKSAARDCIPLCPNKCHNFGPDSYHQGRENFHKLHGPDYGFIEQTRKLLLP